MVCKSCLAQLKACIKLRAQMKFTEKFIWSTDQIFNPEDDPIELHCHACNILFVSFAELLEHISIVHSEDQHLNECDFCESLLAHQAPVDIIEADLSEDLSETDDEQEVVEEEKVDEPVPILEQSIVSTEADKSDEECQSMRINNKQSKHAWFDCHLCDKSYTRKQKLRTHLWKLHQVSEVPDEQLKERPVVILISDADPLVDQVHPFACHLCQKSYSRKDKLKLHLLKHHQVSKVPRMTIVAEFPCSICNKIYKTQQTYDKHQLEHNPNPFHCIICEEAFGTRKDWRLHENQCLSLTAIGDGHHQCLSCHEIFDCTEAFKVHLKTAADNCNPKEVAAVGDGNNKICDFCGESFAGPYQLQLHREKEHVVSVDCLKCGKVFENRALLKKHMDRNHKDRQAFECTQCGQKLSRSDKLAEHMRLHTGFSCASCNVSFATRKEYVDHRRSEHAK